MHSVSHIVYELMTDSWLWFHFGSFFVIETFLLYIVDYTVHMQDIADICLTRIILWKKKKLTVIKSQNSKTKLNCFLFSGENNPQNVNSISWIFFILIYI